MDLERENERLRAELDAAHLRLRELDRAIGYGLLMEKQDQVEAILSLRAVVDKLPKTADGVRVTPRMTLWWDLRHDGNYAKWNVNAIRNDRVDLAGFLPFAAQCYSTQEAAEAAARAAREASENKEIADV